MADKILTVETDGSISFAEAGSGGSIFGFGVGQGTVQKIELTSGEDTYYVIDGTKSGGAGIGDFNAVFGFDRTGDLDNDRAIDGDDYLVGDETEDIFWGGGGDDILIGNGQLNNETTINGIENTIIRIFDKVGDSNGDQGEDEADIIYDDYFIGDILFGNEGNDSINGNLGDDLLNGGPGNDIIFDTVNDEDENILIGGDGWDYFIIDADQETASSVSNTGKSFADFLTEDISTDLTDLVVSVVKTTAKEGLKNNFALSLGLEVFKETFPIFKKIFQTYILGAEVAADPEYSTKTSTTVTDFDPTEDVLMIYIGDQDSIGQTYTSVNGSPGIEFTNNAGDRLVFATGDRFVGDSEVATSLGQQLVDNALYIGNDQVIKNGEILDLTDTSNSGVEAVIETLEELQEVSGQYILMGAYAQLDVYGTAGTDFVYGTDYFGDVLYGYGNSNTSEANDSGDGLYGLGGDDIIYGGLGRDELHGNDGEDDLIGGGGDDNILVTDFESNSYILQTDSVTVLETDDGEGITISDSRISVVSVDDELEVTLSASEINAVFGGLHGGAGNDSLDGGTGNDWLIGGEGDDTLDGDSGNDVLYADDGINNLTGGFGNDTFFVTTATLGSVDASVTTITDFEVGIDTIEIYLSNDIVNNIIDNTNVNERFFTYKTIANSLTVEDDNGDAIIYAPLDSSTNAVFLRLENISASELEIGSIEGTERILEIEGLLTTDDSGTTTLETVANTDTNSSVTAVSSNQTNLISSVITPRQSVILDSGAFVTLNDNGSLTYEAGDVYYSLQEGDTEEETIYYEVTDSITGEKSTTSFTVTIEGENDAPTDIALSNLQVAENNTAAIIGDVTVTDDSSNFTFTVNDNRFEVVNSQLKLKDDISLDFETENSIDLEITVTDDGNPNQSFTKNFTITVTNVNEAPTDITLSNSEVAESNTGAVIGELNVTDVDSDNFTFTVNDNRFEIINSRLKLKDDVSLDFETENSINLEITVTDDGNPNQSFNKSFTVAVTDVNDAPTDIALSNSEVAESNTGAVIGELNVTDVDSDNFTFSVNDSRFEVVNSQLKLKDDVSLDFETENSIDLEITVTDDGNPTQSFTKSLTLNVTDVNTAITPTNPDLGIFTISREFGKPVVQVTLSGVNSEQVNELGVFTVDDSQGSISILPDSPGYTQSVLERGTVIFSALNNSPNGFDAESQNRLLEFANGENIRFYLVKDSTTDAVLSGETPTSQVIFSDTTTLKSDLGNEGFSLSWNDANADSNFDDLVVKIQPTESELPLGTFLENSSKAELIDLTGITETQVTAEFSVFREAAFDNQVYFYKVDNIAGEVDGLTADSDNYLQAVLDNIITDAVTGEVVEFSAENQGVETGTAQIETGLIIAPMIIVDGSVEQLTDNDINNDPSIYFPYLGANSDGVDHIQLLADNTFGFEDLPDGGDFDYNDLIVKVDFK